MAYRCAVHESKGASPNIVMLGREVEVPLDVTTEVPPDAPPLQTDYAQAVQKRLAPAHDLARQHLNKVALGFLAVGQECQLQFIPWELPPRTVLKVHDVSFPKSSLIHKHGNRRPICELPM